MRYFHPLAIVVALTLGTVGAAHAQSQSDPAQSPAPPPGARPDTPPPASLQFKAMDGNNDGRVSTGEFEDVARAMFDAMDADKDDNVNLQEMESARQRVSGRVAIGSAAAARKIRDLDTNADGVLSRTEHRDAATRVYGQADGDNDGNLTTQEFEAAYTQVMASLAP